MVHVKNENVKGNKNVSDFFLRGGGGEIFKITTSFLGRGHPKFDMFRYEGGRGQKRPKKSDIFYGRPLKVLITKKQLGKLRIRLSSIKSGL